MPFKLLHPVLWPSVIADRDLSASFSLLRYAELGLFIREKLEIEGPFNLVNGFLSSKDLTETAKYCAIRDRYTHDNFAGHQEEMLAFAKNQFLINAFSIFEFFVANLLILIWGHCAKEFPEDGKLVLAWDGSKVKEFLDSPVISSIREDSWMKGNFKSSELTKRIQLLEGICGITIRDHKETSNGIEFDWQAFKGYERHRHNVAHTSGRNSLYVSDGLARKQLSLEEAQKIYWYLEGLFKKANSLLYINGIFTYEHNC